MRLAVPSGLALLYLLIGEAFTPTLKRRPSDWILSGGIKLGLVALCELVGLGTEANIYGFLLSLMLVTTASLMFEPGTRQPQGATGSALPIGQGPQPVSRTVRVTMTLISLAVTGLICWLDCEHNRS